MRYLIDSPVSRRSDRFFDISIEINRIVCYNNEYIGREHLLRSNDIVHRFYFLKTEKSLTK